MRMCVPKMNHQFFFFSRTLSRSRAPRMRGRGPRGAARLHATPGPWLTHMLHISHMHTVVLITPRSSAHPPNQGSRCTRSARAHALFKYMLSSHDRNAQCVLHAAAAVRALCCLLLCAMWGGGRPATHEVITGRKAKARICTGAPHSPHVEMEKWRIFARYQSPVIAVTRWRSEPVPHTRLSISISGPPIVSLSQQQILAVISIAGAGHVVCSLSRRALTWSSLTPPFNSPPASRVTAWARTMAAEAT
jgi:hypothetical protein